jgi:hypothetical protein
MRVNELVRQIYPLQEVPIVSPNRPVDLEEELAPLLGVIANETSFLCELHAVCVSHKAILENTDDIKPRSDVDLRELKAKVEILYRALQQSGNNWDSVSRIITVIMDRPHSRLIKSGR